MLRAVIVTANNFPHVTIRKSGKIARLYYIAAIGLIYAWLKHSPVIFTAQWVEHFVE
jgi:hypothetical protein